MGPTYVDLILTCKYMYRSNIELADLCRSNIDLSGLYVYLILTCQYRSNIDLSDLHVYLILTVSVDLHVILTCQTYMCM